MAPALLSASMDLSSVCFPCAAAGVLPKGSSDFPVSLSSCPTPFLSLCSLQARHCRLVAPVPLRMNADSTPSHGKESQGSALAHVLAPHFYTPPLPNLHTQMQHAFDRLTSMDLPELNSHGLCVRMGSSPWLGLPPAPPLPLSLLYVRAWTHSSVNNLRKKEMPGLPQYAAMHAEKSTKCSLGKQKRSAPPHLAPFRHLPYQKAGNAMCE